MLATGQAGLLAKGLTLLCCSCLQAAPSDCSLAVGSQTLQFAGCSKLTLAPAADYTIFYTLTASPDGAGTVWQGGLRVKASQFDGGKWAG